MVVVVVVLGELRLKFIDTALPMLTAGEFGL